MGPENRIVFVYNADSGTLNALKDYVQKNVSPDDYECNLCALTYGNLGMKKRWRRFIDGLDAEIKFLHRDEFREMDRDGDPDLPAAFVESDGGLDLLITSDEINHQGTLEELMDLVEDRVGEKT